MNNIDETSEYSEIEEMMLKLKQQNHTETLMKHTILSSVDATKQRVGLSMNSPAG